MKGLSRLTIGPSGAPITSTTIFHPLHYTHKPTDFEFYHNNNNNLWNYYNTKTTPHASSGFHHPSPEGISLGDLSPEAAREFLYSPTWELSRKEVHADSNHNDENDETYSTENLNAQEMLPKTNRKEDQNNIVITEPSKKTPKRNTLLARKIPSPPTTVPKTSHPKPLPRLRERPGAVGPAATWKRKTDREVDLEENRKYWRRRNRMLTEFESRMYYRYELPTLCRLISSRIPEVFSPPCLSTTPLYEFALSET